VRIHVLCVRCCPTNAQESRAALVRIMLAKPGTAHAMSPDDVLEVARATLGYRCVARAACCDQ
jgi:hypothetical protein